MISRIKDTLGNEFINDKLFPSILSLKEDPVSNIRLNVAKCLESLAQKLSDSNIRKETLPVLKKLKDDNDFDVKYQAEKAMKQERIHSFCF